MESIKENPQENSNQAQGDTIVTSAQQSKKITKENLSKQEDSSSELKEQVDNIRNKIQFKDYDAHDLLFMSSLSEAVLAKAPTSSRKILYAIFITFFWLLIWASQAEIDEITRGNGKIIPSGKNQMVQNLEGGIIEEILVHLGDEVKKDQVLLKIDNKNFASSYGESKLRLDELQAKYMRLYAEANNQDFDYNETRDVNMTKSVIFEKSLFDNNQARLREQVRILEEQVIQRQSELKELQNKIAQTQSSYNLMLKEVSITEPLFRKGLVSEVEFLKLQRDVNNLKGDLNAANLSVPRIQSTIKEVENKISEAKLTFISTAKKELNEVAAEISRLNETQISLSDKVERTVVKSPVDGIVSKLMVNTVSGVIKPGMDIAEIVPLEDKLIAEVKVKPADVAFLRPGLKAIVKLTAYDFSIYGGLEGEVTQISADTETNEKTGESYYFVRIQTEKNYLGSEAKPLRIKVGMVASADIITGKKTVLDYLLKPILKAKQNALRER
jgi:type I secretion membrane fusion protein, hlyD family